MRGIISEKLFVVVRRERTARRTICPVPLVLAAERLAPGDLGVERRDASGRANDEGRPRVDRSIGRGACGQVDRGPVRAQACGARRTRVYQHNPNH